MNKSNSKHGRRSPSLLHTVLTRRRIKISQNMDDNLLLPELYQIVHLMKKIIEIFEKKGEATGAMHLFTMKVDESVPANVLATLNDTWTTINLSTGNVDKAITLVRRRYDCLQGLDAQPGTNTQRIKEIVDGFMRDAKNGLNAPSPLPEPIVTPIFESSESGSYEGYPKSSDESITSFNEYAPLHSPKSQIEKSDVSLSPESD